MGTPTRGPSHNPMKQTVFHVAGLHCPAEELMIRNRLEKVRGIDEMRFNLMTRELTVTHQLTDEHDLLQALAPLKLGATLRGEGQPHTNGAAHSHECHSCCDHDHAQSEHEHGLISKRDKILLGISGGAAVLAECLEWAMSHTSTWPVIILAVISIVVGGREVVLRGLTALRTFSLNINFLMMLAVIGAAIIGKWPEAAMVTFLFALAETIEGYALDRARNAIRSLMALSPEQAEVRGRDNQWQTVPAGEVKIGQVVRVKPGDRVPLDGIVTTGGSSVNQAPITGESMPVEKGVGDNVFAGTVNERGSFEFRVTAAANNTTLARIIKTVQEAQSQRAPTQRFVDSFARYYTPAVVLLALVVAIAPPLLFHQPWMPWIYKSLVMLVIACPCALVLSTPVTVVSGLAAAAHSGVLIKGGVHLEAGRKLKAIAFDKTGTLTWGKPQVTDVVPLDGPGGKRSKDEVLQLAASLEAPSEHPVASAIAEAFDQSGARLPLLTVDKFRALAGRGAGAQVGGSTYFIGNHALAEENRICGPHVEEVLFKLEEEGKTTVVLSDTQRALAVIGVADTLRDTSIEAVREMQQLGIHTVLLTGDNKHTAKVIAEKVGIDDARGDLLPEDKLKAIEELLAKHKGVGMVGDGINDAPALARSTLGFAMGAAGTDTAMETADVALMEDDLRKLPFFLRLSRLTSSILAQNITLAIGIKAVFFALALSGRATLWMAVFADLGASLLVVGNGLRLLRYRDQ